MSEALQRAYLRPRESGPRFIGVRPHRFPFRQTLKHAGQGLRVHLARLYHDPEVRQAAKDVASLYLTYQLLRRMPTLRIRALNTLRRWRGGKVARTTRPIFTAKTVKRFLVKRAVK